VIDRIRQTDTVSREALQRWCATLDMGAATSIGDGQNVPQGFHWCLCLPPATTAELGDDGHPRREGADALDFPRRMWAASSVEFVAPIPMDSQIVRDSRVISVNEKTGRSGRLKFQEVDHLTVANGVVVVRERQSVVYRGTATGAAASPPASAAVADLGGWQWQRSVRPNEAQLFRYSALTFNSHRIHYDRPYAVGVEGYPGLVVHGPLIGTLLIDLCRRQLGHQPLSHFSFRAQAPAFVNEMLHLVGNRENRTLTLAALGGDGRALMSASAKLRQ
jgi:3-methylfumaryl-CoA hydratase